MKILVIDGQGGGIGRQLVTAIKNNCRDVEITAVGANSIATSAMLKAGADIGATGERPVVVGCRNADVIVGPIAIVVADALYGEFTPNMALAVVQISAKKIFIPLNHCNNYIAGVPDTDLNSLIKNVIDTIINMK